jgi:hypothetical protein
MYKEPCPKCAVPLPLWGPTMKILDERRLRSRVEFECPACKCRLERRLSNGEKALLMVGAVALGSVSVLSLLIHTHGLQAQAIAKVLYILAAVVSAIEIRNEFARRRFYLSRPTVANKP